MALRGKLLATGMTVSLLAASGCGKNESAPQPAQVDDKVATAVGDKFEEFKTAMREHNGQVRVESLLGACSLIGVRHTEANRFRVAVIPRPVLLHAEVEAYRIQFTTAFDPATGEYMTGMPELIRKNDSAHFTTASADKQEEKLRVQPVVSLSESAITQTAEGIVDDGGQPIMTVVHTFDAASLEEAAALPETLEQCQKQPGPHN